MSVFDLFRGFFGVPGGYFRNESRRDPFFDGMTHEEDDEDDEEDEIYSDGFWRSQQDPFNAWRFGFSLGPDGMRIQEPQVFGQIFRDMEEIFSGLDQPGLGPFGVPSIEAPPPQGKAERGSPGERKAGGNSLRDFMLKNPENSPRIPSGPGVDGDGSNRTPPLVGPHFPRDPFFKFDSIWRGGVQRGREEEMREDRDLDSQVTSDGLDHILAPPSQPKTRSFFQSVTVTKVVKPDGSVEERRTVRDSQGNEETTVTRSGGSNGPMAQNKPLTAGDPHIFKDMQDNLSIFSKLFGGFKG